MHRRHVVSPSIPNTLAIVAAFAAVGCLALAFHPPAALKASRGLLLGAGLGTGLLVLLVSLFGRQLMGRRSEREQIEPSLEMSTLTFAPAPRVRRPPLPAAHPSRSGRTTTTPRHDAGESRSS